MIDARPRAALRHRAAALLLAATTLTGCGLFEDDSAAQVEIQGPASIRVLQQVQLTAVARKKNGDEVRGHPVVWRSASPGVAVVGADGLVLGVTPGTAQIQATVDGAIGALNVQVLAVPVDRIVVSPDTATLVVGATRQFTVALRDSTGGLVGDRPIVWNPGDPAILSVTQGGLVTALAVGSTTVSVGSEGKVGLAHVTVVPAPVASVAITPSPATVPQGATLQLNTTLRDLQGHVVTGRTVTWSTLDTAIARVSATGLLQGVNAGATQVIARSEGATGLAPVTVVAVPTASVTISPDSAAIDVGATVQLSAVARDSNGNALPFKTIAWSSLDTLVARVSASGLVTGVGDGAARIVAASEGVADTARVRVGNGRTINVTITPASAVLGVGRTGHFAVDVRDNLGIRLPATVAWASSDTLIARVDSLGAVVGVAAGSASITARALNVTASASLQVSSQVVDALSVVPSMTVAVGQQAAIGYLVAVNGTPVQNRLVEFLSLDPTIASVDASGVVRGLAAGTANVRVAVEGLIGVVTVTVTP
ncbi:MAG TPA: Ig-like domain-containing protein [Longimicrobiales bacterium]|nr:Ig-like domain-containing protein [Longimicrobiales bacterium]